MAQNLGGRKVKKKIMAVILVLTMCIIAFVLGHKLTIYTMSIETDGDGDSAFLETLGITYFVGINGYEVGR